jgi:hypothetical protein
LDDRPGKPSLMWRKIYHEFQRWAKASGTFLAAYRRTEITVETGQIWIVRKSHSTRGWCPECGREVDMVPPREAAMLAGLTGRQLTDRSTPAAWHWAVDTEGSPLICVSSALRSKQN